MRIILLLSVLLTSLNAYSQLTPEQIHDKISGSVVVINLIDGAGNWTNKGSGVFVDSSGTLWTNFHLFKEGCSFEIENEFRSFPEYKIIGADPDKDILILKVEGKIDNFINPVSNSNSKKGQKVFAYGNPQSTVYTFSEGIISNLKKDIYTNQVFTQITASISGGSSGGALVNELGQLIGITNSSYIKDDAQNLNFAVLSDDFFITHIADINDEEALDVALNYCMAYLNYENGNYQSSANLLSKYIEFYPNDGYGYYKRGVCNVMKENYKLAISDFDKAIELNNNSALNYRMRGYANMFDSSFIDARFDLEKSLLLEPEDSYTHAYLAMLESDYLGNYERALELCNSAIKILYEDPYIRRVKGNVYLSMKDTSMALECYTDALYLDSLDTEALYKVAELSSSLGYFKDAVQTYSTILRTDEYAESDPDIYYSRGIAYRNLNKMQNAIQDLHDAKNIINSAEYLTALGFCYLELDNYEEAKKHFRNSIKYNKSNWEAFIGLAIISFNIEEFDDADEYFNRAVGLSRDLKKGLKNIYEYNKSRHLYWKQNELSVIEKLCMKNGFISFGSNKNNTKASEPVN